MRAVYITRYGGPEVLQVWSPPDPSPARGQVRVRAKFCGLNFAEVMARKNLYPDAPKAPCVVGYEASGVIDAVGEGVDASRIGQRVMLMTRFGGHADTICTPANLAIPIPDSMSFEEGAAIPVNYLTAYHMLFRIARVRPGEKILIHMAAGGVGIAVLQLLKTIPDVEIFGTASASKHDVIREEGCHHPIDYRTRDYVEEVRRITGGKGLDLVMDALGGGDWRKGYNLLRPTGRLISFGFANMSTGESRNILHMVKQLLSMPIFVPMGLQNHNKGVLGVNMGHLWDETEMLREEMTDIMRLYGEGYIKPRIDSIFSFEEAGKAHERMESRGNVGKVLLRA